MAAYGVLAFSLAQSPLLTLALFLAIGTGMATPYLVLLAFPAWAPRAGLTGHVGRAINRLLGFGLLAGALFYGQEFLPPMLTGRGSILLLSALLAVWAVAGWRHRRTTPAIERALAPSAFALAGGLAMFTGGAGQTPAGLQWQPISQAEARPGRVEGPALIEFTADWCINCKVLERTVYADAEVTAAAGDAVATLQLDLTDFDAGAQSLLQSWGGTGLPYAVVIDAEGRIHERLRDLFGKQRLVRSLESVSP